MKYLYLQGTFILMLFAFTATSQISTAINLHTTEKPTLFTDLPTKTNCRAAALQNVFSTSVNTKFFNTKLSNELQIEGTVLERVEISPQQLSINIRCTNFHNALFNISRITQTDGTFKYTATIVNPNYGDILLLVEERKGQYTFIKQKLSLTMVD